MLGTGSFFLKIVEELIAVGEKIDSVLSDQPMMENNELSDQTLLFTTFSSYMGYLNTTSKDLTILILNPSWVLPSKFFQTRFLKVHCQNSLLPKYPSEFAPSEVILSGENHSGITWHTSDDGLLSGRLILQSTYDVYPSDTAWSLSLKGFELACSTFQETLEKIKQGKISTKRMNVSNSSLLDYAQYALVEFDQASQLILRQLRACEYRSSVGSFFKPAVLIGKDVYRIPQLILMESTSIHPPGTIVDVRTQGMQVATQDRDLLIPQCYHSSHGLIHPYEIESVKIGELLSPLSSVAREKIKMEIAFNETIKHQAYSNFHGHKSVDLFSFLPKVKEKRSNSYRLIAEAKICPINPTSLADLVASFYIYLYRLNNYERVFLPIVNKKTLDLINYDRLQDFNLGSIEYPIHPEMSFMQFSQQVYENFEEEVFVEINPTFPTDPSSHIYSQLTLFIGEKKELLKSTHIGQSIFCLNPKTYELSLHTLACDEFLEHHDLQLFTKRFDHFFYQISNEQKIANIPLLLSEEHNRIVYQWNQTDALPLGVGSVMERFIHIAESSPDLIAFRNHDRNVSYQEARRISEKISINLYEFGIKPRDVVAVYMTRDIDFWLSVLGIWHLNCIYLPLDLGLPKERVEQILVDSGAKLVITDHAVHSLAMDHCARSSRVTLYDSLFKSPTFSFLPQIPRDDDLAYIIYTSGSTGIPKGVMIEHLGMINHLESKIEDLKIGKDDIIAQIATQSFDISIWQFIAPLIVGGTVSVFSGQDGCEPERICEMSYKQRPTILELVPSHMMVILDELELPGKENSFNSVKYLFLTGEGLNKHICERWFALKETCPIINGYGATESSDDITHFKITKENYTRYPEILPVSGIQRNSKLYVLDRFLNPLPSGSEGEIFISGISLGRGYLNRPMKTAETFGPHPFHSKRGERIYHTGDYGIWQQDGILNYCGRKDNQVKLRGHRIEIEEIEGFFLKRSEISQAKVIIREDLVGQKRLIAYLVKNAFDSNFKGDDVALIQCIKQSIVSALPEYMAPNDYVFMNDLPLKASGKLDTAKLPPPTYQHLGETTYVPPLGELEKELVIIWQEILGLEKIGRKDHFFKIGGHSLQGMRIMSMIRKKYNMEIPSTVLFESPTIEDLGKKIESYFLEASKVEK